MEEETNPWKIISARQVYDNNWIEVTAYDVINPNGGQGIYGKVHFKNIAIGIVVLDRENHTYLVGQYRFTIDQYSWEIPEGGGPIEEDPLSAAKRELLEETGLRAREWSLLLTLHLSNSVTDEVSMIYLARDLEQGIAMPEETEQLIIRRLPLDEVMQMIDEGLITDVMSVTALQKIRLLQLENKFDN